MHFGPRVSLITLAVLLAADLCPSIHAWNFKLIAVRKSWFPRAGRKRPFIDKKNHQRHDYQTQVSTWTSQEDFIVPRIDRAAIVAGSPPLSVNPNKASKWDLPRHSEASAIPEKLWWDMELFLGRTAMVAALFLLFGEIMSRESMASQIASLFTGNP
jgi:hypothetical protein